MTDEELTKADQIMDLFEKWWEDHGQWQDPGKMGYYDAYEQGFMEGAKGGDADGEKEG